MDPFILILLLLIHCDTVAAADFKCEFWFAELIYCNSVTITDKLKKIRDVLLAAADEECSFTCPEDMKPEINENHIPKSNGCGTEGLARLTKFVCSPTELTNCCNNHDICYVTCGSNKDVCDRDFQRCLYSHCNYYKQYNFVLHVCKVVAKTLHITTFTLDCQSYPGSQRNACYCPPNEYKKYS